MIREHTVFIFVAIFIFASGIFALPVFASVTDGTIDGSGKYAWSENTGWIDFGTTQGNVHITDTALTGYAWSENTGWISLNCSNTNSCATVDYKVANDSNGTLSGYAWSENVGWIQFNPTGGGVTINASGEFLGYAWGENIGWLVLNCSTTSSCATVDYKVKTDWLPQSARPRSSALIALITAPPVPAPTRVQVTTTAVSVRLTWVDPVAENFSDIVILRNAGGGTFISGDIYATVVKGVQTFTDRTVISGETYKYFIRSRGTAGNIDVNTDTILVAVPLLQAPKAEEQKKDAQANAEKIVEEQKIELPAPVPAVPEEVKTVLAPDTATVARAVGKVADASFEQSVREIPQFAAIIPEGAEQTAVVGFIAYGTQATVKLGEGERAGVLDSYRKAYGDLPKTETEWQDALRIGAGALPERENSATEAQAVAVFQKIYKRAPVIAYTDASTSVLKAIESADQKALATLAYGLRPEVRNLSNEQKGIGVFKGTFGRDPKSAEDWDAVRMVAYSGVASP
ncbi:hypothetical protein HY625_02180 [Candidatus Uhrbacteria bacterium]|nr:hypothetical protein [Candidatus Uhrbacteria bacterium]